MSQSMGRDRPIPFSRLNRLNSVPDPKHWLYLYEYVATPFLCQQEDLSQLFSPTDRSSNHSICIFLCKGVSPTWWVNIYTAEKRLYDNQHNMCKIGDPPHQTVSGVLDLWCGDCRTKRQVALLCFFLQVSPFCLL